MKKQRGISDGLALVGMILIILVLLVLVGMSSGARREKWEKFSAAHDCKKTAHVQSQAFNTYNVDAKGGLSIGVGATSELTGWTCSDGVTYYNEYR